MSACPWTSTDECSTAAERAGREPVPCAEHDPVSPVVRAAARRSELHQAVLDGIATDDEVTYLTDEYAKRMRWLAARKGSVVIHGRCPECEQQATGIAADPADCMVWEGTAPAREDCVECEACGLMSDINNWRNEGTSVIDAATAVVSASPSELPAALDRLREAVESYVEGF